MCAGARVSGAWAGRGPVEAGAAVGASDTPDDAAVTTTDVTSVGGRADHRPVTRATRPISGHRGHTCPTPHPATPTGTARTAAQQDQYRPLKPASSAAIEPKLTRAAATFQVRASATRAIAAMVSGSSEMP